ncbi:DNA cytosine methyltransferase [Candidatus Bathyarchaeota archaeon]|nr:MAG: DNA cytosine methyltransferase [Candidatus Bathyarchaeota archaeon]
MRRPPMISLFTGAMGLDLGFERVGFELRLTLDINKFVCETIRANRPDIPIICNDIRRVSTDDILRKAGLGVGGPVVITGGPPCQAYSTAGKRRSVNDTRPSRGGDLVFEFLRVIREAKPQFFVFENVTGLLSAAIRHISFYERMRKKEHEIPPDARLGTAFEKILEEFISTGYRVKWSVLNAADYGVPQARKRLFIVGSRDGVDIPFPPPPTHGRPDSLDVIMGRKKPWLTLKDAIWDLRNRRDLEYLPFPSWGKYLKYVPPGGSWVDIPRELQREAMGGAFYSQGGRRGFYRRLSWDKPSPTLVTSPTMKATCLCHPDQDRPLSVEEYARIQCFPDDWKFVGTTQEKYKMIGEAVPPPLAFAVAKCIMKAVKEDPGNPYSDPHLKFNF